MYRGAPPVKVEPVGGVHHHRPGGRQPARQPPHQAAHRGVAVDGAHLPPAQQTQHLAQGPAVVPQQIGGAGDVDVVGHHPPGADALPIGEVGGLPQVGGVVDGVAHGLQQGHVVLLEF